MQHSFRPVRALPFFIIAPLKSFAENVFDENTIKTVAITTEIKLVFILDLLCCYTINSLEQQYESWDNQRADLEVQSARLQSLNRVANSKVAKELATVTPSGVVRV